MGIDNRGRQLRRDTIKLSKANGGYHYGGCFSCMEILSALNDEILLNEDIFILSKGHACWGYYVLLRENGFNPKLTGHPERDVANGIHCTTGSMGHGFPTAVGIAMAKKLKGESGKVYVLMGDGECQEGTTWESMLIATRFKLNNLVVIVDFNSIQGSGYVYDILPVPIPQLGESLNWNVTNIDGHNTDEIIEAVTTKPNNQHLPTIVLARTVKGKGVSFMENKPKWHARWLDGEEEKKAYQELAPISPEHSKDKCSVKGWVGFC